MKIIYRANDGTDFDDKNDCLKHENKIKESDIFAGAKFIGEGGETVTIIGVYPNKYFLGGVGGNQSNCFANWDAPITKNELLKHMNIDSYYKKA